MVLRRRQLAANDVAGDQKVSGSPVDVTPLESQKLTRLHAGAKTREHPREPVGEMLARGGDDQRRFFACQRVDVWLGNIALTKVLAHPKRGIGGKDLVVDGLRQDRAEGPR